MYAYFQRTGLPCCYWLGTISRALIGREPPPRDDGSPYHSVYLYTGPAAGSLSHSSYNSPCCLVSSGNNLKLNNKESSTKAERMENAMNMQGLLAVLEEDKADLVGRRETHFAPVPLTGVQLEVF